MIFRALKNRCFFLLSYLLRKPKKSLGKDRYLVVSTTGLGDSLWSSVAIFALKQRFPNASIDLLTNSLGKEIFAYNPSVSNILLAPKNMFPSFFSLRRSLMKKDYAAACILHSSQRWILPLVSCANIAQIIGTKNDQKGLQSLLTHPVEDATHEIDRRGKIVEVLGAFLEDPSLCFFLQEEEKLWGEKWIATRSTKGKTNILLHPGAKDGYKCWPEANYIALAKKLRKEKNATIFFGVGPGEEALGSRLKKALPSSFLVKNLPLRNYASILYHMELVITNDTGPMHLTCALKKPVLAFFCPTDPKRCGPYAFPKARILQQPRACSPCLKRSCCLPFCLRQISVDHAFKEALSLFT